jgi:hypothetical protein
MRPARSASSVKREDSVEALSRIALFFSKLANQNQDQHDNHRNAEAAPTIVAGTVESSAAKAAESPKQRDDQNDEQNSSYGHDIISLLENVQKKRLVRGMSWLAKLSSHPRR